jgi:hypothetical protein
MAGRSLKEKWLMLQMIVTDRSLTPGTKIVAARLLHHLNSQHGRCDPGYETLAEGTGYARRAVMRMVKSLIDADYLRRTRREVAPGLNSSNIYGFAWDRLSGDLSITMEDEDGDTPITTSDGHQAHGVMNGADYSEKESPARGASGRVSGRRRVGCACANSEREIRKKDKGEQPARHRTEQQRAGSRTQRCFGQRGPSWGTA